jgi:putative ABC transport system substrate-binding protein
LGGKTLELLKEIVPRLARVAIPAPAGRSTKIFLKQTEASARALGVQLIPLLFQGPENFEDAFTTATNEKADAFLVRISAGTAAAHRRQFIELAAKTRLPAIYTASNWVDAGGLMAYGRDRIAMYQRAATYVDKILKKAKPGDLPVEAPTKFELIINLKTAKQIGLTIPPNVLARADTVIR